MQRLLIHMQNTVQLRQPVRSIQCFYDTSRSPKKYEHNFSDAPKYMTEADADDYEAHPEQYEWHFELTNWW